MTAKIHVDDAKARGSQLRDLSSKSLPEFPQHVPHQKDGRFFLPTYTSPTKVAPSAV